MYNFLNDAIFPSFRKFSSIDFLDYSNVYIHFFAPYSDISPINLLVWLNIDGTLEVSLLDGAIVLKYSNPFALGQQNFIILAPNINQRHIEQVFDLGEKNGYDVTIREQPKRMIDDGIDQAIYSIDSDRNSAEYILDSYEQATLIGKKYGVQRRRMRHFEREHADDKIDIQFIDKPSEEHKLILLDLLSRWPLVANDNQSSTENREFEALTFAIQSIDTFHRPCLIVYINGQPIGFSLYSIYGTTAIVGHIKVDYSVQYAFDYVTYVLATEFNARGIKFMNFEQDLGIPGLREHKLRLRPIHMLEKVNISRRPSQA
jgi:uncharacterized protein